MTKINVPNIVTDNATCSPINDMDIDVASYMAADVASDVATVMAADLAFTTTDRPICPGSKWPFIPVLEPDFVPSGRTGTKYPSH